MIKKSPGSQPDHVLVTFEFPSSIWAETVHLVGEFNDWNQHSHPLTQHRDAENWSITLELSAGREYQFRYLVDGKDWYNDWQADKYVTNNFGGDNSVVVT
jgi:1,4-alpha-glucan branching enzyme